MLKEKATVRTHVVVSAIVEALHEVRHPRVAKAECGGGEQAAEATRTGKTSDRHIVRTISHVIFDSDCARVLPSSSKVEATQPQVRFTFAIL